MFDPDSRYARLPTAVHVDADGREIVYVRRRFLPRGGELTRIGEVRPGPGERVDALAARALGEPTAFWRLCDAADVLHPRELVEDVDDPIPVPMPEV